MKNTCLTLTLFIALTHTQTFAQPNPPTNLRICDGEGAQCGRIYYVGPFAGSTPADDNNCGTGLGAAPAGHPCETLAYWTSNRRQVLVTGDAVYITGTHGPAATSNCIVAKAGVRYEGRAANNTALAKYTNQAVINASQNSLGDPCQGKGIMGQGDQTSFSVSIANFTLKNLTFIGASAPYGGGWMKANDNSDESGMVLDGIRITGMTRGYPFAVGEIEGGEDNGCANRRRTKNFLITNSSFDNNNASPGLYIGCADGGVVEHSTAYYNGGALPTNTGQTTCAGDGDGIQVGGLINGAIRDNILYDNCEGNLDLAGICDSCQCDGTVYNNVVERNIMYDSFATSAPDRTSGWSSSHCAHNNTYRNNFIWGYPLGVAFYSCAHHDTIENNTIWVQSRAIQFFNNHRAAVVRNNLFRGNANGVVVYVDRATTGPEAVWENNVVLNANSSGGIIAEYDCNGGQSYGSGVTPCETCGVGINGNNDPQAPKFDPGWDVTSNGGGSSWLSSLSTFRTQGDSNQWFGPESGDTDRWQQTPAVMNTDFSKPGTVNLHLQTADTVAQGAGACNPSVPSDIDGNSRPQKTTCDSGADEVMP